MRIIVGMATILVNDNSARHIKRKVRGSLFSDHFKFLTFKENIGTSAISMNDSKMPEVSIINGFEIIGIMNEFTSIIFGRSG